MTRDAPTADGSEVIDRVPAGTARAFLRTYALRLLAAGEDQAGLALLRDRPLDATVPPPAPGPQGGRRG